MKYLSTYKLFESSDNELSIDLVKEIIFSVYEDDFDNHKFEFFNYVNSVGGYQNEIDFIPNSNVIYFNIDKDKWNTKGSIRIEIISNSVWSLDKYDSDKYKLFSELISEWGWRVSEPNKNKPSEAAYIYRPHTHHEVRVVLDTFRRCVYSIIPN
jgi:hypothetical protein